ncbi:MAG: Gfo/Idh/MocA family oxidoreductase [Chloroflexota bacterium]
MKTIRWGLLSTANINRRVIPAIRQSARGELVAVASRSEDSAVTYAKEWDIPQTFASYDAMLQSDAVDAVYIGLPNHLHADWAIEAMRHSKHVLCEKPFALTVEDVDRMTAVAKETGMVLAEAFMYRHHPQTKLIGEWVHNGRLGEIQRMEANFSFALTFRNNIRLEPKYGGGSLWDVGVYPVSLAQYVMGEIPSSVFGHAVLGETGVDEQFVGQMHYSSGRVAQFSSSFQLPYHTEAQIFGTNGRLVITRPFTNIYPPESTVTFYPADGKPQSLAVPEEYLYLGEVRDMHDAILDGKSNYLTWEETRNHIRTVLKLYESAERGTAVTMD